MEEGRVYLVMELLTGGDLLETLADMGTYREHEAILVFRYGFILSHASLLMGGP